MKKIDSSLYTNNKHFDGLSLEQKIVYLEDILNKTINIGINKKKILNWNDENLPSINYMYFTNFFKLHENKRFIGQNDIICKFYLQTFPGCCGIALVHGFYIHENYRHLGIGELMITLIETFAQLNGYSVIVCTDVVTNIPMKTILTRREWKSAFDFINIRTENQVELSYKRLF
jgi:hypothetical protein